MVRIPNLDHLRKLFVRLTIGDIPQSPSLSGIDWRRPQETWRSTSVGRGVLLRIAKDAIPCHVTISMLSTNLAAAYAINLAERAARLKAEEVATSAVILSGTLG